MSEKQKSNYLPRVETATYFVLWTGAVVYSIYRVYLKTQNLLLIPSDHMVAGWDWTGRKQDMSGSEWRRLISVIPDMLPYIIAQILVCEAMAAIGKKHMMTTVYITTSFLFCYNTFGAVPLLIIILQVSLFYAITLLNSTAIIWIAVVLHLILLNMTPIIPAIAHSLEMANYQAERMWVIIMWNTLRCTSYSLDAISYMNNSKKENTFEEVERVQTFNDKFSYHKLVSYCFFVPTLITGPVILYTDFEKGFQLGFTKGNIKNKYWTLILYSTRFIFWMYFTQLGRHFVYSSLLDSHPSFVQTFSPWELCGYGILIGQCFCMKYIFSYGLASAFSRAHGIDAPGHPKCILRIHLYSDMWRYFDQGLYKYIVRYIYFPFIHLDITASKSLNKFFASIVCYLFIYLWHGMQQVIMIWSLVNFIGVNLEGICKVISESSYYKNAVSERIGHNMQLRLNAALTSTVLVMSLIANICFTANFKIGHIFMEQFLFGEAKHSFAVLFFLFCCCHVGHCIKNWETQSTLCKHTLKSHLNKKENKHLIQITRAF